MATPFRAQLALLTSPFYVEMNLPNSTTDSNLLLVGSINSVTWLSLTLKTTLPSWLRNRLPHFSLIHLTSIAEISLRLISLHCKTSLDLMFHNVFLMETKIRVEVYLNTGTERRPWDDKVFLCLVL